MSNLGALITTFTPAPNCTSIISGIVHTETVTTNGSTTSTTYKYHSLGPENTVPCFPPAFRIGSDIFYSPGVCPQGWTSACGSIEVAGTVTETRATCCPLGYTCETPPPSTVTWSTLSCISSAISVLNVTVPDVANQQSMVVELQPIINEAAVNVRWQESDFAAKTIDSTSTGPSSSSQFPAETSSSTIGGPPTQSPSTGQGDSGGPTSSQVKIGVGVGVGIGGSFLLGAAAFCFWYVRRRSSRNKQARGGSGEKPSAGGGGDNTLVREPELPIETWAQFQPELQTADNTPEMATLANTHELNNRTAATAYAQQVQKPTRPGQMYAQKYMQGYASSRGASELP
ncbi:hypothetical protein GGS24DRAFT_466392 [Hypoxylon argillaceum]|nr:hypothetical protein GGS24DRAFT_466392 [Hypoxylon argillaceum]KAI1155743.1 hypothetical protein F4825DRAFT_459543 [Nemania diffusa]